MLRLVSRAPAVPSLTLKVPVRAMAVSTRPDKSSLPSKSDAVELPKSAQVVICGGGIIGCSLAYHLAKLGMKDVLLLEQGSLSCGTTWHAAGLIGKMRGTFTETKLSDYGAKLYANLEQEVGLATGWRQCGSITVARNQERLTLLRRNATKASAFGIRAEIIGPSEIAKYWPHMRTDDLVGALWLPEDGEASPSDLCQALAKGARNRGARLVERVTVEKVITHNDQVVGVKTDRGDVQCEIFVNTSGQWSRDVGKLSYPEVPVPLHSAEHFYIVSKAIPGVLPDLPIMRDPDGYTYFREWGGGIVAGGFEPKCKPVFHDGIPKPFEFELLQDDWDHFSVLMDEILLRVPALQTAEIRQMVNGPESFTADNQYILGEAPQIRKYYVAAGMNSSGIASAAGAGKALSEWIYNDEPTMDLWAVDVRRFAKFNNNKRFLRDRTLETLGLHYQIPWPKRELESCRAIRRSPLYDRLSAKGASWGAKLGWERPNWFAPAGVEPKNKYTFNRQNWFPYVRDECKVAREGVVAFDVTSFSKFLVQGRDAATVMNRICANNMDVDDGKIIYTGMLNARGGFETDVTVTRLSRNQFLIISPTAQTTRDYAWITRNVPTESHCVVTDVTSAYSVLAIMGPKSRDLLKKLGPADLSDAAFPFGTSKDIDLGYANVRASRITYVGELGWELYIPQEFTAHVYEALHEAGASFGLKDCGYYAIDSLRVEKAYRAWGAELSPDYTPLEAGLGFAVDMEKAGGFIGKEALVKQKKEGIRRRLVNFVIEDPEAHPWGDEAIIRDGKIVGFASSAAYGHTLGRAVCMGYVQDKAADGSANIVTPDYVKSGKFEIEIAGRRYKASASLRAPFDPNNLRVKGQY